jgi:hypothetical protein
MKRMQEYMNDTRILNDKGLMNGPEEIRIIHTTWLRLQDETAGMTTAERSTYLRKKQKPLLRNTASLPQSLLTLPVRASSNFVGGYPATNKTPDHPEGGRLSVLTFKSGIQEATFRMGTGYDNQHWFYMQVIRHKT